MRRILFQLHKYSGLLFGLVLALTGLSGSLLVFDHALDEVITPELHGLAADSDVNLQQSFESALKVAPEGAVPKRVYLARAPGSPHTVRFTGPAPDQARIEVSVDPDTAEVLVVREWGQYPMSWVYRFHYTLLSGHNGELLVGGLGFMLLLFCISGVYLWWPRRRRQWRHALRVSRDVGPVRFYWDLHRLVGIIAMPVLALCAITGMAMVFSQPTAALVGSLMSIQDRPEYKVAPTGARLSLDHLLDQAQSAVPDAGIKRLFLPQNPEDSLRLSANFSGEPWNNHGASSIWVNPYSGEVLGQLDARKLPAGNAVLAWMFPLHNADVLGISGRWLWLVAGLTPGFLFATGIYLWWRKRR